MFILAPLKRRSIALLWGGQVLSNVGDEIYKVAMVWMAADLIGLKAGYLTAGLACLVFIFSLIGGIWADNWDHRLTMFWVDVLRVFALLTIPLASYLGHLNLFVLVIATGVVASLTAFFDPALRSIIPEVADEPELLQATNGLMEMSGRLARVVGPGLIGVAKAALPMVHFFTLNAVTFSLSALSLMGFRTHAAGRVAPGAGGPKLSMRDSVLGGIRLVWAHDLMRFVMVCASIINALWMLVFPLAIGLLLHERMPEDVRVLARVISAYGVGNVLANIVAGSLQFKRPERWMFCSWLVVGVGFWSIGHAATVPGIMASAALSATAGPVMDIAFLGLVQRYFPGKNSPKVYRLSMSANYAILFVALLVSPALFALFSIPTVISICGWTMGGLGIFGLLRLRGWRAAER